MTELRGAESGLVCPEPNARGRVGGIGRGFSGQNGFSKCNAPCMKTGGIAFLQRCGFPTQAA